MIRGQISGILWNVGRMGMREKGKSERLRNGEFSRTYLERTGTLMLKLINVQHPGSDLWIWQRRDLRLRLAPFSLSAALPRFRD